MQKNNYFLFVILMFSFQSCIGFNNKSERSEFNIQNNSDSAIYVYLTSYNTMPLRPKLKLFDTLKIDGKDSIITPVYRINAYKFYEDFNKNNGHLYFDDFLKIGEDSILKLYFIKESIMKSYPWESICKYKLYSKKTSVTKRQLNNVKCVVYTENK